MITENGSIKVTTELTEEVQKEFSQGNYKMGLAFTIIGAIGLAVFFVLEIVSIFLDFKDGGFFTFWIIFAVILGCGIGLMVIVRKSASAVRNANKAYTYEFFKDYFLATESLNGEIVTNAKFYIGQVIRSRETKNYLFFYVNAAAACPVAKSGLTDAEINTLRKIFRLPVKGGTVDLSAEILQAQSENTQRTANESCEPFDEFKN